MQYQPALVLRRARVLGEPGVLGVVTAGVLGVPGVCGAPSPPPSATPTVWL